MSDSIDNARGFKLSWRSTCIWNINYFIENILNNLIKIYAWTIVQNLQLYFGQDTTHNLHYFVAFIPNTTASKTTTTTDETTETSVLEVISTNPTTTTTSTKILTIFTDEILRPRTHTTRPGKVVSNTAITEQK